MTDPATLFDPTQIYVDIPANLPDQLWQQSQQVLAPGSRWQTYLNQICLEAVLPWLQADVTPQPQVWPSRRSLLSLGTLVNGTATTLGDRRCVLIPSEAIDLSELRVPQEWVDIPRWIGDYYLAVQVNVDDGYVRVWGYTTHQQLKTHGQYDSSDRTYVLSEDDLTTDLNVFTVAQQLCPTDLTRAAIASLPALSVEQAHNLIQRLGNPDLATPRLAISFELWGALLDHDGWRQRLYEQRQGLPEQQSIWQWLQISISQLAQQAGWERVEFQPAVVGARGIEANSEATVLTRQLAIAGQLYELRVIPQGDAEAGVWRFELRHAAGDRIPGGFKIRLLTEDLQPFDHNEDVAIAAADFLFIEVALAPGEGIVWETEPLPDAYEREILRF